MKVKWGNILALLLIVAGAVGYFQWDTIRSYIDTQRTTSVAPSKDSVIYARDTWITGGIPELGIARDYHRDYRLDLNLAFYGDDQERVKALGTGKAHISEISWPSLLYNLEHVDKGKHKDQIVVLGFIDYSRGGDGIIVQSDIKTVNDLVGKRVGYFDDGTGKYMISFLLRMVDLRMADVKGTPYDDEAALQADFAAGKLDAIAYWQPGMNEVLAKVKGAKVLLSTADMPSLIPSVLVANRKFVADNPARAESFLKFWFATVKHIQERPDTAFKPWAESLSRATYTEGGREEQIYGDITPEDLREIFTKEVRLVGFEENLKLLGITQQTEIPQMVAFAVDNWNRVDDVRGPNPDTLVNNRIFDAVKGDVTLKAGAIDQTVTGNAAPIQEKPKEFVANADPGKLDEVAQMAIPNIEFGPDSTALTPAGKKVITDVVVPLLKQFPNFYLLVDGHTDVGGDDGVLTRLAQGRADSVKRELAALGFPEAQVIARGFGDRKPLYPSPKNDTEKAKNRRTEFRLLREPAR